MGYNDQIRELLHFIKIELDSIEQASDGSVYRDKDKERIPSRNNRFNQAKNNNGRFHDFTAAGLFSGAKEHCLFCKSPAHITKDCKSAVPVTTKKDILRQNKLCFRCTKSNHTSKFCRSRDLSCEKCGKRHVTTMCEGNNSRVSSARSEPKSDVANSPQGPNAGSTSLVGSGISDNIYLKTACALIQSPNETLIVRMIIDGGSQLSFIREDVSRSLDFPVVGRHKISVQCFGQKERAPAILCNRVKISLRSQYSDKVVELCAVEVPEICFDSLSPPSNSNPVIRKFSRNHFLADFVKDPQHMVLNGFSLLIGADYYWQVVYHKTVKLSDNNHF